MKILALALAFTIGTLSGAAAQSLEIMDYSTQEQWPNTVPHADAHMVIRNTTDSSVTAMAFITPLSNPDSLAFQFCWADICWAFGITDAPDPEIIAAGDTTHSFSLYVYPANKITTAQIRAVVFVNGQTANRVEHIFNFDFRMMVGLFENLEDNAALAPAFPNPASQFVRFNYTLEGTQPGELRLLDATGRQVLTQPLARTQGQASLSVQGLPSGLYTAQLLQVGQVLGVRRVIVGQ